MAIERKVPGEIRIFLNHVYEFKKGVRNMVLYTMNKEHEAFAIRRLERQNISYLIQEVNANKINLFFFKNALIIFISGYFRICQNFVRDCFEIYFQGYSLVSVKA